MKKLRHRIRKMLHISKIETDVLNDKHKLRDFVTLNRRFRIYGDQCA